MKTPDYLTESELEQLLKTARDGRDGVRNTLLIALAYHHCLRVSELLTLKRSDVANGRIRVTRLKGSVSNEQSLQSAVGKPWRDEKKLLARYLADRQMHPHADSELLFLGQRGISEKLNGKRPMVTGLSRQQVYNIVHDAALAAGIPASKARSHILKHTGISHLVQRGMPLLMVRDYAGHRDYRSTLWYTGLNADQVNRAASAAFAQS